MQDTAPWIAQAQPTAAAETRSDEREARRRLGAALLAGALTHALFRHASIGVNLAIWSAGAAAAALVLFRGRRIGARGWLASAGLVLLGLEPVVHASDWALGWALPAWFVLLALLPAFVREDVAFADVAGRPLRAVLHVPASIASAARMRGLRLPPSALGKTVVGVLLGAPFTFAFLLLLSFDDDFVAALGLAYARLGTGVSIALCTLLWTVAIGISIAAQGRGLVHAPRVQAPAYWPPPYRTEGDGAPAMATPKSSPWVAPLTWSLALGQVTVVLLGYVAVSARHGFGGHSAVREAGETYASYLHAGVLQLLMVAALSVGLVLGGHLLLGEHRSRRMAALECALLSLSGATLASCFLRIRVYEQAYGATLERMGVAVVAAAVAVVLALTMVKSLRTTWRGYATTAALALVCVTGAASFFDADASVARTNLDRASAGRPLDERYLASLSADACAAESHPYLRAHPDARAHIAGGWAYALRDEHAGWRSFRGLRSCAAEARSPLTYDEGERDGEGDARRGSE